MKLPTLLQRIVAILILTTYYLLLTTPAFAQVLPANTNPDVPKTLHTHTQTVMIEVMASMICQLTGKNVINRNQTCLGIDQQTGKIGFAPQTNPGKIGGAIGIAADAIAMTYTPPLHTSDYVSYLTQNFGIAKKAYAANTGTGFDGLLPIINLWVAFRNLVYLLFVAVFAVVGFGIMLRINIDPRTVMTIANQLPKIIVAILLVTFSFAISGFLIDLMYVSIYVTTNVIVSANPDSNHTYISQETAQKIVQSTSPFEAANAIGGEKDKWFGLARIAEEPANALGKQVGHIFDNDGGRLLTVAITGILAGVIINKSASGIGKILDKVFGGIGALLGLPGGPAGVAAGAVIGGTIGTLIAAVTGGLVGEAFEPQILGGVVTFIAYIVIVIAILWALFRLSFELIKSYIFILIDVVFAPFWIIGGLIPGSGIGFGAWLKEIISHLSVFPVTIGMFLLGRVFMTAFNNPKVTNQFAPPMISNPNADTFASFIGLGIILITPQVLTIMKELIKAPAFKQTGSIAGAVGFGLGAINIPQHMQKLGTWGYYSGEAKKLFGKGVLGRSGTQTGEQT